MVRAGGVQLEVLGMQTDMECLVAGVLDFWQPERGRHHPEAGVG